MRMRASFYFYYQNLSQKCLFSLKPDNPFIGGFTLQPLPTCNRFRSQTPNNTPGLFTFPWVVGGAGIAPAFKTVISVATHRNCGHALTLARMVLPPHAAHVQATHRCFTHPNPAQQLLSHQCHSAPRGMRTIPINSVRFH